MKYTPACPLDQELFQGQLGLASHYNRNFREVARERALGGKVKYCKRKKKAFQVVVLAAGASDWQDGQQTALDTSLRLSDLELAAENQSTHARCELARSEATRSPSCSIMSSRSPERLSPYRRSALVCSAASPHGVSAPALRYYGKSNGGNAESRPASPVRARMLRLDQFKEVERGEYGGLREIGKGRK